MNSNTCSSPPSKVFVIHGRDEGMRQSVARFLAALGITPVLLVERSDSGGVTIMEELEQQLDAEFAVVLLSPDDQGHCAGQTKHRRSRARQNVIFEFGLFIGKLGRRRIFVLKKGELELPTDVLGLMYTDYDCAGAWQLRLARDLKKAGYLIDGEKLLASLC